MTIWALVIALLLCKFVPEFEAAGYSNTSSPCIRSPDWNDPSCDEQTNRTQVSLSASISTTVAGNILELG